MLNHHTEGLHKNQIGPPEDSHLDNVEFADNPEARCPVVLIVDTSSSMTGEPIARVNEAIADFRTEISRDHLVFLRRTCHWLPSITRPRSTTSRR